MPDQPDLSSYSPLTEVTYYILLILSPQPKHGYAIMKDVQALSGGRVLLSTGTLYGAIKRLLEQGWIKRVDDEASNDSGRVRKAYALTKLGRRALEAEVARLYRLVSAASSHSLGEPAFFEGSGE